MLSVGEISHKELHSLRIGDVVAISTPKMARYTDEGLQTGERIVTIKDLRESANIYDNNKISGPVIEWEPEEQDTEQFGDKIDTFSMASSHYITRIVKRAPYRIDRNYIPNGLYGNRYVSNMNLMNSSRRGNKTCMSLNTLSRVIIGEMPHLDIKYGIQEGRIRTLWEKDGRPGLKGYSHRDGEIITHREGWGFEWIDKKQLKRWLMRNISRVVRTKREYIADLIEIEKDRYEDYAEDCKEFPMSNSIEDFEDAFEESQLREFDEKYGHEPISENAD